ncbi:MAG: hypothetical protein J7L47_08825 [Candidatus Odinarchaeota archaeon]|nr:hypothetical protein [Candidatus Odinarchaeota archaeon]
MLGKNFSRKILFVLFLSLFMFGMLGGFASVQATTNYTPQIFMYSDITKDIVDMNNVFLYKDENGENVTLSYWVPNTDENMTFSILNVELTRQFENATVDTSLLSFGAELSASVELLRDSKDISYLLIKVSNSSALTADTWYGVSLTNLISGDFYVDNSYYALMIGQIVALNGTISNYNQKFRMVFLDEFNNEITIRILLNFNATEMYWEDTIGALNYMINGSEYNVVQVKLQKILDNLTKSYSLVKLKSIQYEVLFKTGSTLSSYYEIAGKFYACRVLSEPFKIENTFVHKLSTISVKADSSITSTIGIKKIADVTIPAKLDLQVYDPNIGEDKEPFWDMDKAGDYKIKYTWKFSLVDDPAIQFLNTQVNLTLPNYSGFSIENVTEFIVNTQDELSSLSSYKAGDEFTVISNPSVGDLHLIIMTIAYQVSIYTEIMSQGAGWFYFVTHPLEALYWVVGIIVTVIGAVLGIGWVKSKGEETKAKGAPKSKKGLKTI